MRHLVFGLAAALALTAAAGPALARDCNAATDFVTTVGKMVTDTVANGSISQPQRLSQFRTIFRNNADFPTMGRVALGQWWDKLPQNRRAEYYDLVEQLIVRVMFGRLEEFSGQQYGIAVKRCRPVGTQGRQFHVEGPVQNSSGSQLTDVRWSILLNRSGELKVLDVQVAGVWLTGQKKEEFDSFLRSHGGDVPALLTELRSRVGA
jgi:ABC-type transporter MlaC component